MTTTKLLEQYAQGKRDFTRANLSNANLRGANLIDANLSNANLIDANLSNANLRGANLIDANLSNANLIDADLRDANLSNANLSNANLIDADLRDANGVFLFNKPEGRTCYAIWHKTELIIQAGCFWGTLEEFAAKASKEYGDNEKQNYTIQIEYLRALERQISK